MKDWLLGGLKEIFYFTVDNSKWLCLAVGMVSIVLYVAGCKKAGKNVTISIVVYGLLKVIEACLKE